jgi:hypothetical protein
MENTLNDLLGEGEEQWATLEKTDINI